MSSSTPSKLPASAPTVLELGHRRSLEVSRTIPASAQPRLAMGTNPLSNGLDAHLIAIGTPPPGAHVDTGAQKIAGAQIASGSPSASMSSRRASMTSPGASTRSAGASMTSGGSTSSPDKTVFLDGPAFVPPARGVKLAPKRPTPMPPRPRASIALALLFGLLALAIAPFAPLAWLHAAEQLDLIARGARRATGKSLLHAVQGIGIAMTMVAVAATAFGLTVIVVR